MGQIGKAGTCHLTIQHSKLFELSKIMFGTVIQILL